MDSEKTSSINQSKSIKKSPKPKRIETYEEDDEEDNYDDEEYMADLNNHTEHLPTVTASYRKIYQDDFGGVI